MMLSYVEWLDLTDGLDGVPIVMGFCVGAEAMRLYHDTNTMSEYEIMKHAASAFEQWAWHSR